MGRMTTSPSVPSTSLRSSSFPSQSVFSGSSKLTSVRWELFFRRYISISFSMHRDAYVASLMFLSVRNVLMALISPMVPMEIRSSMCIPVFSNRRAIYTTSRRFRSISVCRT